MNSTINSCPLCNNEVPATSWDDNRVFHVECKVCGAYCISDGAMIVVAQCCWADGAEKKEMDEFVARIRAVLPKG